jgi:hypothetical protein
MREEGQMMDSMKMKWRALCLVMGVLLTSLLLGCSKAENVGVARQNLVPMRISITTPNSVAPSAPALVGAHTLRLGARSEITAGSAVAMGSGGLWAEPDALLNETWSRGTATLRDRVRIRTTLHAATRVLGNNVSVPTWDKSPAFDPPQTLSWEVTYPTGAAPDFTLNSGAVGWLSPDRWGTVNVNSQATLTLETGTYYLGGLNLQSGATIELDQARGPVIIYVLHTLAFRGKVVPRVGTAPHLLLGYLGTSPAFVESLFEGALLAPFGSLTLRSVSGTHSGFFFANELIVDAGARVKAQPAVALITEAGPGGKTCRELLAGTVPEEDIPTYCCAEIRVDSDGDGVDDCVDECAFDPAKDKAGICKCGVPDTDTDGDGVPDCQDDCDEDPKNVNSGQCGCRSSRPDVRPLQPAGTKCTDTGCPEPSATCNGSGVCGNPDSCTPAAGNCRQVQYDHSSYWICSGPATQSAAALACRNKQMALARIDSFSENAFISSFVKAPLWMGANSLGNSSAWRWSTSTSNNGDVFWSGAANGTQQNQLFSQWAPSTPTTQRCAVIQANGRWVDVDCNQGQGYVCEYSAPATATSPILPLPGAPAQPPAMMCAQTGPSLPAENEAGFDELRQAVDGAKGASPVYQGPAAGLPPANPASTCPNIDAANGIGAADPDEEEFPDGCTFEVDEPEDLPDDFSCFTDSDCDVIRPGLLCRQVKEDETCTPKLPVTCAGDEPDCEPSAGVTCPGYAHCGVLECPDDGSVCEQFDICPPNTEFTPDSTGSDLDPAPFDPAGLFPGGSLPPVTTTQYFDDPVTGAGKDHSWCFMNPQQGIPDAEQGNSPKQGKAGEGSPITFSFDPDLTFEAKVNPLALGETDLKVHARAALTTKVGLQSFLGLRPIDFEILSAVADIKADRCSLSNSATHFKVFGRDFADMIGVPKFDTSGLQVTKNCNRAVGDFVVAANRAKKAFRDAEQLLTQYRLATGDLRGLCPKLMGLLGPDANVPYFPDGLFCAANEPTEITINRFIDYYQAPGFGEVSRLRTAAGKLTSATSALKAGLSKTKEFKTKPRGESMTIVKANFMIGPVPVVLQLDAFYTYGASGYFEGGLEFPFDLLTAPEDAPPQRIAYVRAGVMPYANAGLSAFVGAGRDLGPVSARVGIEGSVTLGDVKAPIFAGAGVSASVTKDERLLSDANRSNDIRVLADAAGLGGYTHFGVPKSMKFFVWYNYGARIEVTDILRGELNGKVRIKFGFFSRTWRKRIAKFNGMTPIKKDLISGSVGNDPNVAMRDSPIDYTTTGKDAPRINTRTVEGTTPVGYSESQVPLLVLRPLSLDQLDDPDEGTEFDDTQVAGMFYDNLCCAKATDPAPSNRQCSLPDERPKPGEPPPCCGSLVCEEQSDGGTRCVEPTGACTPPDEACTDDAQCCGLSYYPDDTEGRCVASTCETCIKPYNDTYNVRCEDDSDCCGGDEVPQQAYCGAYGTCYPADAEE